VCADAVEFTIARRIADFVLNTERMNREIFYLNHENEMIRFLNKKGGGSLMLNQPAVIEPRKQLSDFSPERSFMAVFAATAATAGGGGEQ